MEAAVAASPVRRRFRGLVETPTTDGEAELLESIEEMPAPFREMGARLHAIVTENAPAFIPSTRTIDPLCSG